MNYIIGIVAFLFGITISRLYSFYQSGVYKQALQHDRAIYAALHKVLEQTEAQRVSIWRVENGGGELKVGQNKYASVVYEVNEDALPYSRDHYQRILLQEGDIKELSLVQKEGTSWNTVALSDTRGILADRFRADGVTYYHLSGVKTSAKVAFFLVLETTQISGLLTDAKNKAAYNTAFAAIRAIFEMNYNSPIIIRL